MNSSRPFEGTDYNRRRFLSLAAFGVAGVEFLALGSAKASSTETTPTDAGNKPVVKTSFNQIKQIEAGVLSVGYAEAGPADGAVVVLLHGWPYDIYSYVNVAPLLAAKGYRVIVPYLRGHGSTRFISSETTRNGQPSAIALDIIALMDALSIKQAIIGVFDL
jgi:hypothetical protein